MRAAPLSPQKNLSFAGVRRNVLFQSAKILQSLHDYIAVALVAFFFVLVLCNSFFLYYVIFGVPRTCTNKRDAEN